MDDEFVTIFLLSFALLGSLLERTKWNVFVVVVEQAKFFFEVNKWNGIVGGYQIIFFEEVTKIFYSERHKSYGYTPQILRN